MGVRHCTPNYGYRTDLITEILSSPYPLRFRSICFESIPCPLRLRTKLLKSTRIHCVYATLFSVFSLPTRTKKADFSLYPYSVANGKQDLKRCPRTRFSSRTLNPYRTFDTKLVYVTPPSSHFKSFPFLLPFPYPCSKMVESKLDQHPPP